MCAEPARAVAAKLTQVVWLAAVWVLLWGTITVANVIVGLLVAVAVLALALGAAKHIGGAVSEEDITTAMDATASASLPTGPSPPTRKPSSCAS